MVAPRTQARSGVDYTPKVIDLGLVKVMVDSSNAGQGVDVLTKRLANDSEAMREIADYMVTCVRENITSGTFTAILPSTVERRRYPFAPHNGIGTRGPAGGSQPLVASRALINGIEARSRSTGGYAAAQRGDMEWYGFLHDRGVGELDRRTFMELSDGQQDGVVRIYDEWLTGAVESD